MSLLYFPLPPQIFNLYRLADLIERDQEILSTIETMEVGKPLMESKYSVGLAVQVLRHYAAWCDKFFGETCPAPGNLISMTRKEPVGVVGQIIPWNGPITMLGWKWGPALAAGKICIWHIVPYFIF